MIMRTHGISCANAISVRDGYTVIPLPRSRKAAMTMNDKKYDCTTCPYPRYKDRHIIFCDVCIRKILDEQKEKKRRKEHPNE